ncbi:hypothetical protein IE983_05135 [Enterobacter hormaechei]|uniref:Uncharacterized protein n=1 Tax=Enterobacter hormaechei TaxID=158836 RepID=A0A927DGE3_9ENTR|nr:hypothetical protein [Enterobacter hormaechei]
MQRTRWEQIEDHLIAVRDGTYSIKAGHAVEACRKGKLLIDALWHRASRKGVMRGRRYAENPHEAPDHQSPQKERHQHARD